MKSTARPAPEAGVPRGPSLRGARILVTRGAEQASEFADRIRARGGDPVLFPTVRIVPVDDPSLLDGAIARLSSFDWILFPSANAVRFFCDRAEGRGVRRLPAGIRAASVGPGTSRAMRRRGLPVDLEAETHTGEGLAAALAREGASGKRFLVPRALEGREALQEALTRLGGLVTAVPAYMNGLPEKDEGAAAGILADPPAVCTFASPSSFANFFRLMGDEAAASVLSRSAVAVIGEVTARAVTARGIPVDVMPEAYTLESLLDAVASFLEGGRT